MPNKIRYKTGERKSRLNDPQASDNGLEVVVIQIFIYVRVPLIIGASEEPINNGEGEVNENIKKGVQGMQEADWNGTQARVNHHACFVIVLASTWSSPASTLQYTTVTDKQAVAEMTWINHKNLW